jgi:bifunctional DNA-binding transcriptional regulator/antitoxin component of YhaV-PrlF toxin-antitoxin module
MAHLVGKRGQVVIEKPLRDALGVRPGFVAVQTVVDDHLEIRFFPPGHGRSLRGRLAEFARRSVPPADWTRKREEAWAERVRQDWGREDELA